MPSGAVRDGAAFSRFLRERGEGAQFGAVLDALAHEIWLAQERLGFSPRVSEAHAAALAVLLEEVRPRSDLLAALVNPAKTSNGSGHTASEAERKSIIDDVLARAQAGGHFERSALIEDLVGFLLDNLLMFLVGHERLLILLQPALVAYKATLSGAAPASPAPPAPTAAAAARPTASASPTMTGTIVPIHAASGSGESAPRRPINGALSTAGIQARHGLTDAAMRRFEATITAQNLTPEQRMERLDELAGWLAVTVAQLTRPGNEDAALRKLKADAAAALTTGDFERAVDLLGEVRRQAREGRRRSEQRLAEEMQNLHHQMAEEAAAVARLAELALARFDFDAAADLFGEAASSVPKSEPQLEQRYRLRQADALAAKGEERGDLAALAAAVRAYRDALSLADRGRDSVGWALIHVSLANALAALGWRDPASPELTAAVAAYDAALEILSRQTAPMRWAVAQLSRGATLMRLGEHAEREQRWLAAASALVPALEIFEGHGATEYAELARTRLRQVHETLNTVIPPPPRALKLGGV
jgi:tetratricopeptide (TPR) repeat protein